MQTQRTLRLTESQYATIIGSCYDGLPDEACGLFIGPLGVDGASTGAISQARPCRNADASARTYTVDPRDMLAAGRAAEAAGDDIVGVWHSHTHTDAYPSPTDVRQAVDRTWWYVIVSLRDDAPVLRAYHIVDGAVVEDAVELGRG
ncbi:MAG TPA: M67 family metallopeptidase [Acidimicrobiia bacterium]|nr:M67 family metallopeptidase [Acidimicrobiia bacterium]